MLLQRRRDHRCLQLEEARTGEARVQTRLLLAVMVFRRGPAFHERVIPLVGERVMQVSHNAGLARAVVALCHGCGLSENALLMILSNTSRRCLITIHRHVT